MEEKILFVDDEQNVLDGLRRQLRKSHNIETALGPLEGLDALRQNGPFAVIVSDMRMPLMNGAQFLAETRTESPDTIRMILSGQSELDAAVEAVNHGSIFRFLTKPCPNDVMTEALDSALNQYRLMTAERELLEQTLSGSIRMLTEVLGLVNPEAFSRTRRIQQYAEGIAQGLGLDDRWQIRLAAMLSQIGCITLPGEVMSRVFSGEPLTEEDREMFHSHPAVTAKLLSSIPRLENVARMVAGELEPVDLEPLSADPAEWDLSVAGAQILRASIEFDSHVSASGGSREDALRHLRKPASAFAPKIVEALSAVELSAGSTVARSVTVEELRTQMIVDEDVRAKSGALLVPRGEEVTYAMLMRLRNFAQRAGIEQPFRVLTTA